MHTSARMHTLLDILAEPGAPVVMWTALNRFPGVDPRVLGALQGFPEDEGEGSVWRKPRVTLRHVAGSCSHSGALREAGVAEADAVIVGSAHSLDAKEVENILAKYSRSSLLNYRHFQKYEKLVI